MKMRFLTLALVLWASCACAQVPMTGAGVGAPGGGGGAACSPACPGDVVGSAAAFWSTARCYTFAYSGNAFDLVDTATGNTTGTRMQCAGGALSALVSGSACTFVTGNVCSALAITCAVACNIVTLYDESGNTNCASAACNVTQATNANRPAYTAAAVGGKACAQFNSASPTTLQNSSGFAQAAPISFSAYAERTGIVGTNVMIRSGGNTAFYFKSTANQVSLFAGTAETPATANDNAFHAIQGVVSSSAGASLLNVDGTPTTGLSPGTSGFTATAIGIGSDGGGTGSALSGFICEIGVWPIGFNSTQYGNLATNQAAFY